MSDPTPTPNTAELLDALPDTYTLKELWRESGGSETWDVFDRSKKRKLVLKRYNATIFGNDEAVQRFKNDIEAWEPLKSRGSVYGIVCAGRDAEWVWYLRESAGVTRSLWDTATPTKPIKEGFAIKKFITLCTLFSAIHQSGSVHANLKPKNIYFGANESLFCDADIGRFRDPFFGGGDFDANRLGTVEYLAPEQLINTGAATGPLTDIWGLTACLAYAVSGSSPKEFDETRVSEPLRQLLRKGMSENPTDRFASVEELQTALEQISDLVRPVAAPVVPEPVPISPPAQPTPPPSPVAPPKEAAPDVRCPQCSTPITASGRACTQCGRSYMEPCLSCQSTNPFWLRLCRSCGADLLALKQQMLTSLNAQKAQVLKLREQYGHDKTLPILKQMSLVNHPLFLSFRDWARNMTLAVQKERRDIKTYVDNVRGQAKGAFEGQKYEKVRQIIEQVPRPLLDDEMRLLYVEAGECLTEVDSLIREIRNAISTKQYSPLLSCVQRYLELKANDPEARSLQERIEKLTTFTAPNGMKLRRIPTGRFYMGSHETDVYLRNNEHPQHRVQISKSIFIGVYQVTQEEFHNIMEYNPSVSTDQGRCPVDSVTWYSAADFCNKMSDAEGLARYYDLKGVKKRASGLIDKADVHVLGGDGYRLPTEAEWEYCCRAGSITPWYFGDLIVEVGQYAWYFDNAGGETHPIGLKKPNSWGLFDMHGNIMEWCHDWYGEFYYQQCADDEREPSGPDNGIARVLRGGAWQFGAEATRSAYRNSSNPEAASSVIGFRICRNTVDDSMS